MSAEQRRQAVRASQRALQRSTRTEVENEIKAGAWRTVHWIWGSGVPTHGEFKLPVGAQIKVRYGYGWLGRDKQKQTLDGTTKVLTAKGVSTYLRVRFQVKVKQDTRVRWILAVEGPGV